ncbi:MAG: hypothetical protein PHI16_04205 [Methanocellales archaeon]|nr:hypothetical protein [Methanocellales archaeon]
MPKRVIEGRWWIAGTDKDAPGSLICDEKGWNLELNGTFSDQSDEEKKKVLTQPHPRFISPTTEKTILGITKDGKPITLEYFPDKSATIFLSGRGYDSDTYLIRRFFENAHFPNPKQITFKKVLVKFPYLFEWFGQSMVEMQREYDSKGGAKEVRFICKPGGISKLGSVNNLSFALSTYATMPFFPQKEIPIMQETELIIENTTMTELSLEDVRTAIISFRDFLAVAIGLDIAIQSVVGFTDSNREELDVGKVFHPEVVIHDKFIDPDKLAARKLRRDFMNFTFSDLSGGAEAILKNWYQKSQDLKDVFNLYFTTLATPNLNLRNKFLGAISAIEGFVRNDPTMLNATLTPILESMHNSIRVLGTLFTANEIVLITNTRNKLSHIELSDPTKQTLNDYELYDATEKLCAMFEIALLSDLGFSSQSLSTIAKRKISAATR